MARQQKRRRIELGWFEALVLVFGYVASLGIVGIAGIYIGQRAAHQRLGGQERLIRMPIPPEEREARRSLRDEPEITFYDELGKPGRGEGRIITGSEPTPREERRAARRGAAGTGEQDVRGTTPEGGAAQAVSPRDGTTPAARATARGLAGGMPPTPGARAKASAQPGIVAPAPPVNTAPAPGHTGTIATLTKPATKPGADAEPPPGVSPEAAATARGVPATATKPTADGSWSVQVNATRDEVTANRLAERLRARGYDAYIVKQARDGTLWYRVRVGRLPTIDMANALVREIKTREGLTHAFVASD